MQAAITARSHLGLLLLGCGLLAGCHHRYFGDTDGEGRDSGAVAQDQGIGCVGLACQVNKACPAGGHTTVTGKVFAPNGTLPLYNATVFVPSAAVDAFPAGVTCDRCDGKVSGSPLAVALTGPDGSFTLTDVPSGQDIPVVVQLGRWRRRAVIPTVADCKNTELTDTSVTRLPRNASEGDIPRIAIASGNADPFECLLLKIGLDAAEITEPSGPFSGRIHFYQATNAPGTDLSTGAPRADELYSNLQNLLRYDVVLLPCEGGAFDKSQVDGKPLTPNPRVLLQQYLDAGGRVFATHLSYAWFTYPGSPYNKLASPVNGAGQWPVGQPDDYNETIFAPINTTFPKGADFAEWLKHAGATSPPNKLSISEGRHDLTGVDPAYAQPWVTYNYSAVGGGPAVSHFTFNTPLDAPADDMGTKAYCGRTVFSDFHVTANAKQSTTAPFPAVCRASALTDQEKALAFMLFDLSSCVQDDAIAPIL